MRPSTRRPGSIRDSLEDVEEDPALDPTLLVDERELAEAGAELDDPEALATLDGGIDDPDGSGGQSNGTRPSRDGDEGWDLDSDLNHVQQGRSCQERSAQSPQSPLTTPITLALW